MIIKIISGGQYGADVGGLAAAVRNNLETGGWIPKGWRTIYGSNPVLKHLHLQQHTSDKYPPRTYLNVKESDGTIRFAFNFKSAGELCTLKAINQYKRPYIDVDLANPRPIEEVVKWIEDNKIETLNVAGNAGACKNESTKIFCLVRDYLSKVIIKCKENTIEDSNRDS
jgi:hypothetical protein